jgi:hypothetical protein
MKFRCIRCGLQDIEINEIEPHADGITELISAVLVSLQILKRISKRHSMSLDFYSVEGVTIPCENIGSRTSEYKSLFQQYVNLEAWPSLQMSKAELPLLYVI